MKARWSSFLVAGMSLAALLCVLSVSERERANEARFNALADLSAGAVARQAEALSSLSAEMQARLDAISNTTDAKIQFLLTRANAMRMELAEQQARTAGEIPTLRAALARIEQEIVALTAALQRGEDTDERLLAFVEERTAPAVPWAVPIEWQKRAVVALISKATGEVLFSEEGKAEWLPTGTGFLLRPGVLVTAGHVLTSNATAEQFEGIATSPDGKSQEVYCRTTIEDLGRSFLLGGVRVPFTTLKSMEEPQDVGIGSYDPAAYSGPYAEVSTEEPPYGATVWVGVNRPNIRATGPLPVSGLYAGRHGGKTYAETMIVTIPGQPGFSGSALLWRGKVVGIVVHGYGRGDYHWLGHTPIQAALDMLTPPK